MKMKKLSILSLLLISLFTLLNSQPTGPVAFIIFALSWPTAYCRTSSNPCNPSFVPQRFLTHGLWPQPMPDNPLLENCAQNTDISQLLTDNPGLAPNLLQNWPTLTFPTNLSFWNYQWDKHGSCSGIDQLAYFDFGANGFPDMLALLAAKNIVPGGSYPKWQYIQAIRAEAGPNTFIAFRCDPDGGDYILREIYICLDPQLLGYVSCPMGTGGGCGRVMMKLL